MYSLMKNYTDYTFFLSDSTIGKTPVFFMGFVSPYTRQLSYNLVSSLRQQKLLRKDDESQSIFCMYMH